MSERVTVGLEVHAYLDVGLDGSKLFCDCPARHNDTEPNVNVCPVCTGMPGSKPMLPNKLAVEKAIAVGLLLGCTVQNRLVFQRKHYDYPDLPNGYQKTISGSYGTPVAVDGFYNGMGIWEVHLEEDPARWDPLTGHVDYNRSGVPLLEIVTAPEDMSVEEVRSWLRDLVTLLEYIQVLPKGASIKADVNINIEGHPRVEIKNVNSFWSIVRAIEYEIQRQTKVLEEGQHPAQETRGWKDDEMVTVHLRKKEEAQDYRFIPEPDLPVILVQDTWVADIKRRLPENPDEKKQRFVQEYGVAEKDAAVLTSNLKLADLYELVVKSGVDAELGMKWLRRDVIRMMNEEHIEVLDADGNQVARLLFFVQEQTITPATARQLLRRLLNTGFDVEQEVSAQNLQAVSDDAALRILCKEALKNHPQAVTDLHAGKHHAFDFLVGQVMYQTKGRASPDIVRSLLRELLEQ